MHELMGAPQLQPEEPKVHWARKYASEIGVGFFVLTLIFVILGCYWWIQSSQPQNPPPGTGGVTLNPKPTPIPAQTPIPQPPIQQVQVKPTTKIIEQPTVQDIPFISSTQITRGGTLSASVVRIRQINGFTALTFKINGSANGQVGLVYRRPNNPSIDTLIIDDQGRRYAMVNETPSIALAPDPKHHVVKVSFGSLELKGLLYSQTRVQNRKD